MRVGVTKTRRDPSADGRDSRAVDRPSVYVRNHFQYTPRPKRTFVLFSSEVKKQVSDSFSYVFRFIIDRARNHLPCSVHLTNTLRASGPYSSLRISILLFLRLYLRHNGVIILLSIVPGLRFVYPPPPFSTLRAIVFVIDTKHSRKTHVPRSDYIIS